MKILKILALILGFYISNPLWAQEPRPGSGASVGWEFGAFGGNLLPNQIRGVTEITGLGGFRLGMGIGDGSFAETTFMSGNGNGVEWKNFGMGLRMDIPVENLVGTAYAGPDITYYKGSTSSDTRLIFGGHVGGGILAQMGSLSWFRADMKFGLSPGTSLFFGVGLVLRFPG